MTSAPIPPVIQTLQRTPDAQLASLLRAVITQERETLVRTAAALRVEPAQLDFFVIAEAANRWLSLQPSR